MARQATAGRRYLRAFVSGFFVAVPVTVTVLDRFAYVARVEGASMQVRRDKQHVRGQRSKAERGKKTQTTHTASRDAPEVNMRQAAISRSLTLQTAVNEEVGGCGTVKTRAVLGNEAERSFSRLEALLRPFPITPFEARHCKKARNRL